MCGPAAQPSWKAVLEPACADTRSCFPWSPQCLSSRTRTASCADDRNLGLLSRSQHAAQLLWRTALLFNGQLHSTYKDAACMCTWHDRRAKCMARPKLGMSQLVYEACLLATDSWFAGAHRCSSQIRGPWAHQELAVADAANLCQCKRTQLALLAGASTGQLWLP